MNEKFDHGEKVRVIRNIRNDGSFIGLDRGSVLIRRGSEGFIKSVGRLLMDQVIYQVHFLDQGLTVGCRENELSDLDSPWVDRKFERGDLVSVNQSLSSEGKIVVKSGDIGTISSLASDQKPFSYNVVFPRVDDANVDSWVIPESVLSYKVKEAAPRTIPANIINKRNRAC